MKKRYRPLTHELLCEAITKCFGNKYRRNDVLTFIEEWTGIPRQDIAKDMEQHTFTCRNEAIESAAYAVEDVIDDILSGYPPDLPPVKIHRRPDGMTGKIRDIAYLCIMHQIIGHTVKLGMEPLLNARIYPTQHASIPGRGQTKLAKQVQRFLRSDKLDIRYYQKIDCHNAYGTLMYTDVIGFVRHEIPRAKWIIGLLEYLGTIAPGGHLIIGGYLDAWLFNFAMSYAIRDCYENGYARRGTFHSYATRIVTFMDDAAILGKSKHGVMMAVSRMRKWLVYIFGLRTRKTSAVIHWLSKAEERHRKRRDTLAKRGCPNLDMGGFKICRTYIMLRRRVLKRTIRCFDRAWRLMQTKALCLQRAYTIISRNGAVQFANSERFKRKHHVYSVLSAAKRVISQHARLINLRKERWLHGQYTCAGQQPA